MALRDILPKGDGEKAAVRPTAAAMVRAAAVRLGRGIVVYIVLCVVQLLVYARAFFALYLLVSLG